MISLGCEIIKDADNANKGALIHEISSQYGESCQIIDTLATLGMTRLGEGKGIAIDGLRVVFSYGSGL